ncbi:MAG: hypothetical protein JSV51_04630 [Candidatus Bathyarchaeota archaeon]|nr:MAG: hypothetical protein JSV51_04630 [Candidatus Bathyarchaeota archaeon]
MGKPRKRNLLVKIPVIILFLISFDFLSMIQSTKAQQHSTTVECTLSNNMVTLENGHVYLEMNQIGVCISVLKFDPIGSGNYGQNVLVTPQSRDATAGALSTLYHAENSTNAFDRFSAIYDTNGTKTIFVENEANKVVVHVSEIDIANKGGVVIGEEEWTLTLEKNKNFFQIDRNFFLFRPVNVTNVAVFQGFFKESYDAAIMKGSDDGLPMYYTNAATPPYIFEYSILNGTSNDHGTGKIARTTGLNITKLDHSETLFNNTYWNGTVFLDFENHLPPVFVRVKEWKLYDAYFQFMTTTSANSAPTFKVGWTLSSARKVLKAETYSGGRLEIGFFKDGLLGEVLPFGFQKAPEWLITLQWKLYFSILISMNGKGKILPDARDYKEMFTRDTVGALMGYLYMSGAQGKQFVLDALNEIKTRQTVEGIIPTAFTDYVDWKQVRYTSNMDVQAWYVIMAWQFYVHTKDQQFLHDFAESLRKAVNILLRADEDGNYLINAPSGYASDWADTIKRTGEPLFLNSMACWALKCMAMFELASKNFTGYNFYSDWLDNLRFELNKDIADGGLWNSSGGFYSAWRFNNGTVRTYFEVDSNLLAVVSRVASKNRAENVLRFIDEHQELEAKAPCRVLLGLYNQKDILVPEWNPSNTYHNGGYWLWIGGYDILGRATANQTLRSLDILKRIREAVFRNSSVYEWYDSQGFGRWGQSKCEWFSWSAGSILYSIFHGLLGIEVGYNGIRIRGELPSGLGDVTVRLFFRQTNFTINIHRHGYYVSRILIDDELANSLVIPLNSYDEASHTIDVYLSEKPSTDYVYLSSTFLPVASTDFSMDNRLNVTFSMVNFTDEIKFSVPWKDSNTAVRFDNGTIRNLNKTGQIVELVLNPVEIRSVELMHGRRLSKDVTFWMPVNTKPLEIVFDESGFLKIRFDNQEEGPVFFALYVAEYGMPARISIGWDIFMRLCEDLRLLKSVNYDCWNFNKPNNLVTIKTFSEGSALLTDKWGFAYPEIIPVVFLIVFLSFVVVLKFLVSIISK